MGYTLIIMDEEGEPLLESDFEGIDAEFLTWWIDTASADLKQMLPKVAEYGDGFGAEEEGSADLIGMGSALAQFGNLPVDNSPLGQEVACWFYLLGKVYRCLSNYKQKKSAKQDTLHDATVYTMMMRRLQDEGRWP